MYVKLILQLKTFMSIYKFFIFLATFLKMLNFFP